MVDKRYFIYGGSGAALGLVCFAVIVLSAYLYRKRCRKKEVLFGSTVKVNSYNSSIVSSSLYSVQPKNNANYLDYLTSSSETDLSKIDSPEMQCGLSGLRCNSQRSSCDSATENQAQEMSWRVWFKVQYDEGKANLEVTIFRAKCTSSVSAVTKSSVFFILYLLPEENHRQQTAMYPNNGCPSFDETLHFQIKSDQIKSKRLRLSLYEIDTTRTRVVLGHVIVKLDDLKLKHGAVHYLCKDTQSKATLPAANLGEIHVSLSYDVESEKMKVQIFAARDLPPNKPKTKYYLQINLIMGMRSVKMKRTDLHESLSGIFSCSYVFQVPCKHLDVYCLHFAVKEVDEFQEEKPFGYVMIGPCAFTHGAGLNHWKQMIGNTRKVVEMWHPIVEYE